MKIPKQNSGITRFRTNIVIKTGSNSVGIKPARRVRFVCDLINMACNIVNPGDSGICWAYTREICGYGWK